MPGCPVLPVSAANITVNVQLKSNSTEVQGTYGVLVQNRFRVDAVDRFLAPAKNKADPLLLADNSESLVLLGFPPA